MRPDELQTLFEQEMSKLFGDREISDQDREKVLQAMPDTIQETINGIAASVYRSLRKTAPSMLRERRALRRGFQRRHCRLWKKGLDILEAYLVVAHEIGEAFNNSYRAEAAREQDHLFEALVRLQARGVHVGHEVLCLLSAGFADGAHARWRTAHEIAVVANFLARHGRETAERYLIHEVVESYRIMTQYERYADAVGCEHLSDAEVAEVKAHRDGACARFEDGFGAEYGWAAKALKEQGILFPEKRGPRLSDIEMGSGIEHLRPYYRMASHNVHANPKGITFRLGLADGSRVLLTGPSNYGLADPADGIAISVYQTTVPMLLTRPIIDNLAQAAIMEKFVNDVGVAFLEIQQAMGQNADGDQGKE